MQTQPAEMTMTLDAFEQTLLAPVRIVRRLVADGRLDSADGAELEQAIGRLLHVVNHVQERDEAATVQTLAALSSARVERAALQLELSISGTALRMASDMCRGLTARSGPRGAL